jgi:hypothetical protein
VPGDDEPLAELVPAAEMAWADGSVGANERAMLEAYADALVEQLNREAGRPVVTVARARQWVERLTRRRLPARQRRAVLAALRWQVRATPGGDALRRRILEWAQAVAAVDGRPVWDPREALWLETLQRTLAVEPDDAPVTDR